MAVQNDDSLNEIQAKTQDIISNDIQAIIKNSLEEIQNSSNPLHKEIFSQTSSDLKRGKIEEIIHQIKIANEIINKALKYFNKENNSDLAGLELAQCYLKLASTMDYIFKLIKNLNNRKSRDDIQKTAIEEIFAFYLGGKRIVISQGIINDSIAERKNTNIFQLEEYNGELRLIISRSLRDYKELKREKDFDKSVNKHWLNYRNFTKQHYFGTALTGRRLYYLLKGYEGEQLERKDFWDWWHDEKDDRGFFGLVEYFLTAPNLSNDLQEFLRIAQENNNESILGGAGSGLTFGHIAESFERHLEECHHFGPTGYPSPIPEQLDSIEYPDDKEKDGFKGWVRHLSMSTGAWPGTFGPDTTYAQVKQYATTGKGGYRLSIRKENFELAQTTLVDILSLLNNINLLSEMVGSLEKQYRVNDEAIQNVATDLTENHLINKGFKK